MYYSWECYRTISCYDGNFESEFHQEKNRLEQKIEYEITFMLHTAKIDPHREVRYKFGHAC